MTPREQEIRLEEEFRRKVRRDIEEEEKANEERSLGFRSRLLKFFNTQLGLWILGSVLLAGVIQIWNMLQAHWKERDQLRRLYSEVAYRAEYALYRLGPQGSTHVDGHAILKSLRSRGFGPAEEHSAFPEYLKWNTDGLVMELASLGNDHDAYVATMLRTNLTNIVQKLDKTDTDNARPELENMIQLCRQERRSTWPMWMVVLLGLPVLLIVLRLLETAKR